MATKTKTDTTAEQLDTVKQFALTPEEMAAVLAARTQTVAPAAIAPSGSVDIAALTQALVNAINSTRDVKVKPYQRKKRNPYYPTDGSPRLTLRRKCLQHGIEFDAEQLYNEDIDALNKIKPGRYCGGHVRVIKRKDGAIDIDYPVRTSSDKLKLLSTFGITSITALLQRILAEKADPVKYKPANEDDD